MPIYMDVHIIPGVKATGVAEAHQKDLSHQEEYGCKCMTYWIDEQRESIFCLIEAPNKEAVSEMHAKAHGLIPNKVIEVQSSLVESFLGRIYDPEETTISDNGLKVFADPSFRILLCTNVTDLNLLRYKTGIDKANEIINSHNKIIRTNIAQNGGREIECEGSGFLVSFSSAAKAITCAVCIQKDMKEAHGDLLHFRIALNAGEPVDNGNNLFQNTIEFAQCMCSIAGNFQIAIASSVKELVSKDFFRHKEKIFLTFPAHDENLVKSLFDTIM